MMNRCSYVKDVQYLFSLGVGGVVDVVFIFFLYFLS